jgi:hypothetical protein
MWNPQMPSNSMRNVSQIVENSKNFIDILDSCTKYNATNAAALNMYGMGCPNTE